jgi:AraC family transcriptional regulator
MHSRGVERAIAAMIERLDQPLTLEDLAAVAHFSPWYFNRVFRVGTGVPPCRFLATLRMAAAKRLLLTTDERVTDICFDVGYRSLGTFTTQFGLLVGVAPQDLRRRTRACAMSIPEPAEPASVAAEGSIAGCDEHRLVFVGLFAAPLAQGRPAACTVREGPGRYALAAPPDGRFHVVAAAFPRSTDPETYLLPDPERVQVAATRAPVAFRHGRTVRVDLELRGMRFTDPPILLALPFLGRPADEAVPAPAASVARA